MSDVMITVLHGADRGRVMANLHPPITIGREEGNTIQLNDERVSRCHLKIQRDNDALVLTDLQSTNGTKVNGMECHLRILRQGDLISVGRSLLLVGSEEQINERLEGLNSRSDNGELSR
ncbi:MAG: FHA domain-containing protein, partial [Planctomycetota bacterium]